MLFAPTVISSMRWWFFLKNRLFRNLVFLFLFFWQSLRPCTDSLGAGSCLRFLLNFVFFYFRLLFLILLNFNLLRFFIFGFLLFLKSLKFFTTFFIALYSWIAFLIFTLSFLAYRFGSCNFHRSFCFSSSSSFSFSKCGELYLFFLTLLPVTKHVFDSLSQAYIFMFRLNHWMTFFLTSFILMWVFKWLFTLFLLLRLLWLWMFSYTFFFLFFSDSNRLLVFFGVLLDLYVHSNNSLVFFERPKHFPYLFVDSL